MVSKLIDIPNHRLDNEIKKYLKNADDVKLAVSFIFVSGIKLIYEDLCNFLERNKTLTIITSNYLKSTEPESLRLLSTLQDKGAKIYFFDSLKANQSFHIKAYAFSSENHSKVIIGSSNLSISAFMKGIELNVVDSSKETLTDFNNLIENLISNQNTYELTEEIIQIYEDIYKKDENLFIKDEIHKNLQDISPIEFRKPNEAQAEALERILAKRELGINKGLIVMATGLGKTILSVLDVVRFKPKRLLFIAHREEILNHAMDTFRKFIPEKKFGIYKSQTKNADADFIFGSILTIGKKKELEKFSPNHFDYIIVDEFHHAGAKSYNLLLEYFKPKFLVGLTATPNRTDNADILKYLGREIIYEKNLLDGINLGILSHFDYHGINDKYVDYSRITFQRGKFNELELDENLNKFERAEYIYDNWIKLKQTRTLAFCTSIKHCDYMCDFFNKKGIKAVSLHSQSKIERKTAMKQLINLEIEVLFTVDLFNEGVDIPSIDTVLMIRPTESKIIFLQQFGRGLRKANFKNKVVVIDFIGNHKIFFEKPAALLNFNLNPTSLKKFIDGYNSNKNKSELPEGSRIFYDTEVIDFMTEFSQKSIEPEDIYQQHIETHGERPSASEFSTYLKLSSLRAKYNSWFEFVHSMNSLSEPQIMILNKYKSFFLSLEKTQMTKSFKMVVLDILLKNKFHSMSLKDLSNASFEYLKNTTHLYNEIKSELRFESLNSSNIDKWIKYWMENPVKALTSSMNNYFNFSENKFDFLLPKEDITEDFIDMCKEIIDFRFFDYKANFDISYIKYGEPYKDYSVQIGLAFPKMQVLTDSFIYKNESFKNIAPGQTMVGHVIPSPKITTKHQLIFVTLIKSSKPAEHKYNDYFKSKDEFHWQSVKSTSQINKNGKNIISHKKLNVLTHLFVRKLEKANNMTLPFHYCGLVNFIKAEGNNPINVDFKLETPLNDGLSREFLRV